MPILSDHYERENTQEKRSEWKLNNMINILIHSLNFLINRAVSLVGESDRKVLKLAVKNSASQVKHRIIPTEVISKYKSKLDAFKDQVKAIYEEEKEEKEMRKADMEVSKAQNMILHQSEISARPARTWFQSEKERKESKDLSLLKHNSDYGIENDDNGKKGQKRKVVDSDDEAEVRIIISIYSLKFAMTLVLV